MHPESEPQRAWLKWPGATLLALILAAPAAFGLAPAHAADSCQPTEQASDTGRQPITETKNNPCNADPITFQGTTQRQTRDRIKGDCSVESRSRLRTEAQGKGATFTEYKLQEDFTNVVRFGGRRPEQFIDRKDQRIIAQKAGITDEAASWFFTERTQSTSHADGTTTHTNTRTRCRCKRDDEPTPSPSCEPA